MENARSVCARLSLSVAAGADLLVEDGLTMVLCLLQLVEAVHVQMWQLVHLTDTIGLPQTRSCCIWCSLA